MIAGTLKGVISQRLVPTADGAGRVPAVEVLTMTGRVRDMIMEPSETGKLTEVIAEGTYYGMQTFDQSLFELYTADTISLEQALDTASHPHDFKLLVASEGQRSTSVEQLYSEEEESRKETEAVEAPPVKEDSPTPRAHPGGDGAAVSVSPPGMGSAD